MYSDPLGYFITFTVYNSWLHGDARGSFKRGGEFVAPDVHSHADRPSIRFTSEQREIIGTAAHDLCKIKTWTLYEISPRTNHVHLIVSATHPDPERVMRAFKARMTFFLRKNNCFPAKEKIWTQHGSTIYLFTDDELYNAREYVRNQ